MPTALKPVAVVLLAIVKAGDCVAVSVCDVVGDVVVPDFADAVLVTPPASISACVVVYEPVHVIEAFGARPAPMDGHETELILLSLTVIALVSVTLPLLVTL